MKSEFLSPPQSYKPENSVETPYLRARKEWDERLGMTVVQAKNWRMAFMLSALLCLGLFLLNVYQVTQQKVVPFIVGVNEQTGEPRVFGKVDHKPYEPREEEIRYFLSQFVQYVRAVPSDPVVIKKNWLLAYQFLRPSASTLLNNITNTDINSPLKRIGQETATAALISVTRVAGSESFQVRWKEARFTKNGAPIEDYTMTGVFTFEIDTPEDEEALLANPLGLFITNFQWNREL